MLDNWVKKNCFYLYCATQNPVLDSFVWRNWVDISSDYVEYSDVYSKNVYKMLLELEEI